MYAIYGDITITIPKMLAYIYIYTIHGSYGIVLIRDGIDGDLFKDQPERSREMPGYITGPLVVDDSTNPSWVRPRWRVAQQFLPCP